MPPLEGPSTASAELSMTVRTEKKKKTEVTFFSSYITSEPGRGHRQIHAASAGLRRPSEGWGEVSPLSMDSHICRGSGIETLQIRAHTCNK